MPPAASNGADMAEAGGGRKDGPKELILKSPFGSASKVYTWPLKKGRGSLRKSEDKEDEAAEIVETIKYVCEDHPEIRDVINGLPIIGKNNPVTYDSMQSLCTNYNKAVDKLIATKGPNTIKHRRSRANRPHLKHILQQCYNKSVDDPNELNHYEPFTPEVYGETSFELICQILDRLHPISEENKFVDLGSGVGQVVLQVAALTNCQISLGIEKAKAPSKFAREMKTNFEFWMEFYGKIYSKFSLVEGDFLDSKFRDEILASTIIFVNNFAFGPEVDQRLKDVFADLIDGSRIFSSKSFCALNFRITDRNLSDIGTIMHVSKMDPLKGSVSWTGKPVSYFLHVIDRAKLERYFQKSAARKEGEENKRGRRSGRHLNALPALDESSSGSRDDSRASSIEHDDTTRDSSQSGLRAWNTDPGTRNGSDEELTTMQEQKSISVVGGGTRSETVSRSGGRRRGRRNIVKKRSSSDESTPPQVEISSGNVTDSNSSTPPPSGSEGSGSHPSASRPVRAVVANAAAISVAQHDMNHHAGGVNVKNRGRVKKPVDGSSPVLPPPTLPSSNTAGGRKKIIRTSAISSSAALDLLHKATMDSINSSNQDTTAPAGCVNVRLQIDNPPELTHEELPLSLNTDDHGKEIPIELRMYLEKMKKDCLTFMERMQSSSYKASVEKEIAVENKKNSELVKREKQLKSQIDNLISDSLALLKRRLDELGIQAKTPPEFIEKAKMIVCNHHELQRNKASLESEIAKLEQTQGQMIAKKERELIDNAIRASGLSHIEAKTMARRKIDSVLNGHKPSSTKEQGHPILGLSSDVIVTKCPADQLPITTQIRKRPRDGLGKQKDWPEKRHKDSAATTSSPVKTISVGEFQPPDKIIEEKNPEVLAKKILEQGRNLERTKTLLSPQSLPPSRHPLSSQSVEVRKIETPVQHQQQQTSYKTQHAQLQPDPTRYEHRQLPPSQQPHHLVDLPKMEMNMSLVNTGMGPANEAPLVLPPHPPSRSASSELNDDITFSSSKMSSTPRAEQFETRLKNIIQSVLSGDADQDVKPPISLPMRSNSSPPPQQRPMFSPVKKELPSHLPLPPSGVVITSNSMAQYHHQQQQQQHHREMSSPVKRPTDLSAYPQTSSSRTMNDLIASEIEKSLSASGPPPQQQQGLKPYHGDYRGASGGLYGGMPSKLQPPSPVPGGQSATGMARMTQVIEDSIRGSFERGILSHRPPAATKDLEGLACPRTKSPYGSRPEVSMTSSSSIPGHRVNGNGDRGNHDFPVEGLAARFGPTQRAYWQHPPGGGMGPGPQDMPPQPPGYGRAYGHPYPDPYASRKRTSPQMSPVLPPKKQHFDNQHPDYRDRGSREHDNSQQQKWQDEISTGFDRLVAYATEVDKRRRSTDDSNSPQQSFPSNDEPSSTRSVKQEPFDNRMSTLSMKFKGASGGYHRPLPPVGGPSTYGSSNRAVSSIPSPVDFESSSNNTTGSNDPFQRQTGSRSPLPGENLPEHHFKKRYFAETRDFVVGSKAETSSSYSISPVLNNKKRPEDLSFRGHGSTSQVGRSPTRNSSQSSASSQLRDMEEQRKTNSPASSSSLLDSTTMP